MEGEGSCLLQSDLMENTCPTPKSGNQHDLSPGTKTQARMIQCVTWEYYTVLPGGLSLSVGHILYVPVCVYVFVCVCARNSSPKGNSLLGPWSPRSNVCCYLKGVAFVRNNTVDNPELLVLCMDYERKTGDFTNSKASRDDHNHPILLMKVSVTPWGGGKQLCWWGQRPSLLKKRDETSISSHQMMANTIKFPQHWQAHLKCYARKLKRSFKCTAWSLT